MTASTQHNPFPQHFIWGAAAAAYQIEGAAATDGKGPSVWDMMCRKSGAVWNGHTGDIACDHYGRYGEDVAAMRELGLQAYRLSISWPRVMPEGVGPVNAKGLEFYDRLVDTLLEAGIEPWVTLFHWDFPLALYHRGGWLNRDSAQWFADYASVVAERLADRVRRWMTLNEPQVYIGAGHQQGRHAPGDRLAVGEVLRAAHHTLLAHGRAVQALRAVRADLSVGIAPVALIHYPSDNAPATVEAARARTFAVTEPHMWSNTWWLDPVFFGRYPEDGLRVFGADAPAVRAGDFETIAQPLDWLGINLYQGHEVTVGADGRATPVPFPVGYPVTSFDWNVTPDIMYWGPRFMHERYGLPISITENGLSTRDWVSLDGQVHDPNRIDFTHRYLLRLGDALAAGVPVEAYFHWSVLDNFEWAEGYKQRFGLVHVDYRTGERRLKDSARWYRRVIDSRGAALFELASHTAL